MKTGTNPALEELLSPAVVFWRNPNAQTTKQLI